MGRVVADAEQAETDFLIYTSNFCNYCTAVKRLLGSKELTFTEINFSNSDREIRMEVVEETGHRGGGGITNLKNYKTNTPIDITSQVYVVELDKIDKYRKTSCCL